MELNLIGDRIIRGKLYPAGAVWPAEPYTQAWREFGAHWPHTVPFALHEHCVTHGVRCTLYSVDQKFPANSYYAIGIEFFDFDIDYFKIIPNNILECLQDNSVKILFYYDEGDNPSVIRDHLDSLCERHNLPLDCYRFISANTASKNINKFLYFPCDELLYWDRNKSVAGLRIHNQTREREFTALNRLHKSWRATAMADLLQHHVLDNSYWSYCETGDLVDEDNPIEIDSFGQLRVSTERFLKSAPYYSDELDQLARNNHANLVGKYFTNSYCHIVLETHFDADQSGGTFLTEKTFKPIKHGQMFFIAGPAGSLQQLRDMGYRTFDGILDNSYDYDQNNTHRWIKLRNAIVQAQSDLPRLFERARSDIEHNQRLFLEPKTARLNILLEHINESY